MSTGGPGPLLGPIVAVLGCSSGLCGQSGAEKCEEHGYLENVLISRAGARAAAWGIGLEPLLGPMLAILSRSWALCWRSWAYVGGLWLLLGPKLAVLGRFRGLSGRSWDAFGPK